MLRLIKNIFTILEATYKNVRQVTKERKYFKLKSLSIYVINNNFIKY